MPYFFQSGQPPKPARARPAARKLPAYLARISGRLRATSTARSHMAFSWRCCWRRSSLAEPWRGHASARAADLLGAGGGAVHRRRQPDRYGRQADLSTWCRRWRCWLGGCSAGYGSAAAGAPGRRERLYVHLCRRAGSVDLPHYDNSPVALRSPIGDANARDEGLMMLADPDPQSLSPIPDHEHRPLNLAGDCRNQRCRSIVWDCGQRPGRARSRGHAAVAATAVNLLLLPRRWRLLAIILAGP